MKILSIGNSFSEDAQAYLHDVAEAQGIDITCVNLFIGGCTLIRHHMNMVRGFADYSYAVNGVSTGEKISLEEALHREDWDVVTLQESSARSGELAHYEPYIYEIRDYVKKLCPKAKIALHQTWGYGEKNIHTMKNLGYTSTIDMFDRVEKVYHTVNKKLGADIFIPSGKVLKELHLMGYHIHSDEQHASRGIGRYALALTWLRALTGAKVSGNPFRGFEIFISREEIEATWKVVDSLEF